MWDLEGKVILVTGATNGIGRAAALALAARGPQLVLLCRDRRRGEQTREEIKAQTGNDHTSLLLCDLRSQAEIRRAASEFLETGKPLHLLLNNAGVVMAQRVDTEDGIETTFAVNHLGYFLLTSLLLDRIRQSAPARIVNVASDAHSFAGGRLDFEDLGGCSIANPMKRYGISKCANILFTRELARRLDGSGITVNCMNPGFVGSGLARNNGVVADLVMRLLSFFNRSPEKGAETAVYLCASPDVADISGRYFTDCEERTPEPFAQNDEDARRLLEASEAMVGLAS